jgi:NAD(P)-dependent dehydrogenase (short-subunit alcohol dehydrogenase family)
MQDKRIALVTGANQGVGFQVAKALVTNGVTVLVGSRNFERGEAVAKEIGPGAVALQLDVTDRVSITTAAELIRKEFGRLDLLVNNAAISNTRKGSLSLQEYRKITRPSIASLDEIRAVWETNVFGALAPTSTARADRVDPSLKKQFSLRSRRNCLLTGTGSA